MPIYDVAPLNIRFRKKTHPLQLHLLIPFGQFMKPIRVESGPSRGKVPNFFIDVLTE